LPFFKIQCMFSTKYRFLIIVFLGVYSFINTLTVEAFEFYNIQASKWLICLLFVVLVSVIWESNRLINGIFKDLEYTYFWKRIGLTFLGTALITTISTLVLGSLVMNYTVTKNTSEWLVPLKLLLMFAFRINLFLSILNIIFLYQKQLEESKEEIENYKRITSQAQLQSLRNQINPHFLFNNLSVLSELITVDSTASEEFVKQFAKVYRYVLNSHEKELVEIKDELEFIKSYTYLLKTRFSAGLQINISLSKNTQSGYVLPMAIQMLVENAIKHNVISKFSPLVLDVYCDDNELVWVKNNLQLKRLENIESTKVGLSNIVKRYAHFGKKDIQIIKTSTDFQVGIPIISLSKAELELNFLKQTA
jgi:two-component system, LytTR family, sensor kinase